MPKHGKTRKQKMQADMRRMAINQNVREADLTTYSIPVQKPTQTRSLSSSPIISSNKKAQTQVSTIDFQYLTRDLNKTLFLTFSIIIAELMIKYFIK